MEYEIASGYIIKKGRLKMICETSIATRYPDVDKMGIAHHAVYPLWYEIARMEIMAKIGFPYQDMDSLGINPAMVNLNIQYLAPAYYPDSLLIKTKVKSYAPKKLELEYELFRSGETAPLSTATSFHIWTGPDMKSLNLEEKLPEIYEKIKGFNTRSLS